MNLRQHLLRQMAFSHATFGPGRRTDGVIDHIQKELIEVRDMGGAGAEWVDVVILALDGLTRQLAFSIAGARQDPERIAKLACDMILAKQTCNEARSWPDWRTQSADHAIEHQRDHPLRKERE
jgi:hypothetical protein